MTKKRTMKFAALILSVVMAAGVFAGCGNGGNDKDEQGRTIVSVGQWPDREGKALDNINAKKAEFEEANPDVVIVPDSWKFDRKTFYAKAAGGQLPIIYEMAYTEMAAVIDSGYSADITEGLKNRGYEGKFNEQILEVVSDDEGNIRAFPMNVYALGLGCNMDIMKEAGLVEEDGTPMQPKTWDELVEFAVQIKEKTGKPGFMLPTSENCGGWMFTPIAWSYGVDFMEQNEDGTWRATFNTPEAVAALQWVKDLKWKYDVVPANSLITLSEYYKNIATGGAGMYIVPGDYSGNVVSYGMLPEQIGAMAMPAGPERYVTLLGGAVYGISDKATDDQIDAAIRWIEVGMNYEVTDELKASRKRSFEKKIADNQLINIKSMNVWSAETESVKYTNQLIDEMGNANINHVRLYNDFVENCPADIQPEEPVCAQELYSIIDGMIQEVLTNENADCAALIEKAVSDFQSNYLDNL